ncbi:MAG: hypothetical protein VX017_10720, partial [Pseudomonadota bacterium]|nr:hypothetical protein [Pseudomonadota bacterium]
MQTARFRRLAREGSAGLEAALEVLRGAVRGLADSLPPSAVPRVADVLAPLLHSPGWAGGLHGWAAAAMPSYEMPPEARNPSHHGCVRVHRAASARSAISR